MGKHSSGDSDALKFLFSSNNPFCRKPEDSTPASVPSPPPAAELNLASSSNSKRKNSEKPTISSIIKRKKNLDADANADVSPDNNPRRKRKRDELEAEYERRKHGDDAETSTVAAVSVGSKRKAEDVTKEVITSSDAFDDDSKLLRTVFVGNLPLKMKRKALMREFAKFGEIESVRIRSVPLVDSKTPRKGAIIKGKINDAVDSVHAYIVFKDEQSAQAALTRNMAEVGGNHIRVDMACPPRKKIKGEAPLYDRKRTVFVGNLPFDVKDEELYQLFCGCEHFGSNVEAVRVVRDPHTSVGKGIAFVLFKTREGANSAVRKKGLTIRDRQLRISHAKAEPNLPSKRKSPGPKQNTPRKKFAKISSEASSEKNDKTKAKAVSLSYQGLRSSKSGVLKKAGLRQQFTSAKHELNQPGSADQATRKAKRPAVAARKAKLPKKRKQETGTPKNTHRNKKARH